MDDSFYNTDFDSPNCINTGCDVFLISTLLHVVITMKHTSCNQHLIKFDKYIILCTLHTLHNRSIYDTSRVKPLFYHQYRLKQACL